MTEVQKHGPWSDLTQPTSSPRNRRRAGEKKGKYRSSSGARAEVRGLGLSLEGNLRGGPNLQTRGTRLNNQDVKGEE